MAKAFSEFGFDDRVMEGIQTMGYETATPVQEQVIPLILEGRDILASAQTGTGKTAAFLLPLMQRLLQEPHEEHHINALIIAPTRELAIQIDQNLQGISYFSSISSIAVYGGNDGGSFDQEKKALSQGADIVICTPGRMISHINLGYVKLQHLHYLILDEADRMLDMGFYPDLMRIIKNTQEKKQVLMFSATMPKLIAQMARQILKDPAEVNISISRPPDKIRQRAYVIYEQQKAGLILHILKEHKDLKSILIFCSRKTSVKDLTRDLKREKLNADQIHSDLEQDQRADVLNRFASRRLQILVATDILSRGIDIDNIELVINYDVPHDGEDYVHRIGRTARAENDGEAITLISPMEQRKFGSIERLIDKVVEKMPVPADLGEAPEYRPEQRSESGHRKPGGKGNNRNQRRRPRGDKNDKRGRS